MMVAAALTLCEDTAEWSAFAIAAAADRAFPIARGVRELARLGCLGPCPRDSIEALVAIIAAQRQAFARGERVEAPPAQLLQAAIELVESLKRLLAIRAAGAAATYRT